MKLISALFLMLVVATPASADRYTLDHEHTYILFLVNHLGFSDMLGYVTAFDGEFTFDPAQPEASRLDVTVRPEGIRTSSALLDHALQGRRFFNTDRFPEMHFRSTSIERLSDDTGDIHGDLTLLGVTRPVTLHAHFNKLGYNSVTNLYMAGFNASGSIKRSEFGMHYLIPEVSDEVRIEISTEAVNTDRKQKESLQHR